MTTYFVRFGLLLILSKPSYQKSTVDSKSYIGAVVEYNPVTNGANIAEQNANYYSTIIKNVVNYNVDIIVFPEYTLTSLPRDGYLPKFYSSDEFRAYYRDVASYIPAPTKSTAPCDGDSKYKKSLQIISCAAREHKMYVVVNHQERADCPKPNCSPDNFLLYNTNVVFDRTGAVVARYRKYNLFDEGGTNITSQPEYSTFTTDFGVTFGTFVCFDILHEKPAKYFVRKPNVTDVVYSTHWFDELPFNDAVQKQAAWAYGADVNLLASGYSDMITSSGGSGIYAGKLGVIKVWQPRQTSNAVIVAEIPKYVKGKHDSNVAVSPPTVLAFDGQSLSVISEDPPIGEYYPVLLKDDLRLYTTKLIDPQVKSYVTTICDRGLCCDFEAKIEYDEKLVARSLGAMYYRYRFVVFNGVRNVANFMTAGVEVCALVACATERIETCGGMYPSLMKVVYPTTFKSLMIKRRADLSERVFYEPSTITLKKRLPLENKEFGYVVSKHAESDLLVMHLDKPQSDLMTFGIYGRRFDRDGEMPTDANSGVDMRSANADDGSFYYSPMNLLLIVLMLPIQAIMFGIPWIALIS